MKIIDTEVVKEKDNEQQKVHVSPNKKYRLLARNLYLTYSNCDLELEEAIKQLKGILASYIIKEYLLVREYHVDGGSYVHVDLKLLKKQKYLQKPF
jgi:Geminivirus Rep catalytic domain